MSVVAIPARRALDPRIAGGLSFAVLLLVFELVIRAGWISRFVVPPPSEVLASFPRMILEEEGLQRFLLTATETFAAGALMAVVGLALGFLLWRFNILRRAFESWVGALASAPLVLLYPLFLVIFGRSSLTIVMIGFLSGLAPMILKTVEGFSGTRRVLLDVGRSFRITIAQQFWKILFPAAVPTIFVGLRLGMIFCLINIVGVEYLINFGGLGQLVNDLAERNDVPATYAVIGFVILVSVMFFWAMEKVERWLRPAN